MRKDKDKAFALRKAGKTYLQIEKELGVSRSTLSEWFRDVPWSRHLAVTYTAKTWSADHIRHMQAVRRKNLDDLYKKAEDAAALEYITYRNEPLFWAGLMAYAGEGDKRTKGVLRMTNSEFYIHKIFIKFVVQYLAVPVGNIRCGLILYPDLNESLCKEMWSNILGIPREHFHKTQVIQGKEKIKRLQYGIGMSIISSTVLKKKVLKWLALAQDERFEKAGMVQG